MEFAKLETLAKEIGFSYVGPLDPKTIDVKAEVRQMCEANTCRQYGKKWSCPPGCGDLETLRERIAGYKTGILVQTVGELEDDFDVETMIETEQQQKANMVALQKRILELYPNALAIGSGCCVHCENCTYPDAPCRFPEKQMASMEAYGMVVTDVCRANNMKYYYGPGTLAYTSCFLVE
jgi:predicted metal-binding protein